MFRIILLYGIPGAIVVGGPLFWGMVAGQQDNESGAIIGYTTMLVALTGVFLGVKHYRDRELGGAIKFLPALGVGLAISAVASLGWVIAWEASLMVTKLDFGAVYAQMMIESAKAEGASAERLAQVTREGQQFAANYANPVFRMGMTFIEMFPIGVVISLISAALLRNSRFLPPRTAA